MKQPMLLASLCFAVLVSGCSDSPGLAAPEQQTHAFGGACVSKIWGESAGDVWAAGHAYEGAEEALPLIWHFDGTAWSEQLTGEAGHRINDLWGLSGDDVFAVGHRRVLDEDPRPVLLRYDGESWSEMELPVDEPGYLTAVWGTSASNVIAAFNPLQGSTVFLRFDGSSWASMEAQLTVEGIGHRINGIWGSAATDVHAVGERWIDQDNLVGLTARYDGTSWSYADVNRWPIGIHGLDASTVFTVGHAGMIARYDGVEWNAMESGVLEWLLAVWGRAADDVYAVGTGAGEAFTVLHFDGQAWSQLPVECPGCEESTRHAVTDAWGTAAGDLFLAASFLPSGVNHCLGSLVAHLPPG